MTLEERVDCLVECGKVLSQFDEKQESVFRRAGMENPWFTIKNIRDAVKSISEKYLYRTRLEAWLEDYNFDSVQPQNVGLILAGNIPLVGIHDIISVFISGHKAYIKPSSKDKVLCNYFVDTLCEIDDRAKAYLTVVERLKDYDAVIATGSDNSGQHFEKYFSNVPHIIRKNRSAVAIIKKEDTVDDIQGIGRDLLGYFGLGCRNVSKIYFENGVDTDIFFKAIYDFRDVINHNKYKNNYDYSSALYLMNNEKFLTNDFVILRPERSLHSRIACVHYEYFDNLVDLEIDLNLIKDQIQCVVSSEPIGGFTHVPFGQAQCPALDDYADGIDTLSFLTNL